MTSKADENVGISVKTFSVLFAVVVLAAFLLRFYQLDAKPMHHDEAVLQVYYIEPMLRGEGLRYLGLEYHGLMPHLLSYPFVRLLGLSLFSLRFSAALFGALTVALLYFLKDYIGRIGVLFSGAFLAVSPTFVYYSRQYTTYPCYIFFLLLIVIVALKCLREFKTYQVCLLFMLSAFLLDINEAFLFFLLIAGAFAYINFLFDGRSLEFLKKLGWMKVALGLLVFAFVFVLIQTSFFMYWSNLAGLVSGDIAGKAISAGHSKPFSYFFTILIPLEIGILWISAVGFAFFKRDKFSLFLIFWSLSYLCIFSLISYKTNWMLFVVIFPLVLHTGNTVDYLIQRCRSAAMTAAALALLILTLAFSIQQNYLYVNDFERNKLGYVETSIDVNRLVSDINGYSEGRAEPVLVTARGYWPLPVYLKGFSLSYMTDTQKLNTSAYQGYDLYIVDKDQTPDDVQPFVVEEYELRQGYLISVLYRKR
ncbi:MAG: flippase activity-associated protein Agl23 [Candidatus Altiarchaeota archaeon]